MKKHFSMLAGLVLASAAWAHDEGHGPKLSDMGKQGGIVAPVVDAQSAGGHAQVVYKSELVRSEDGSVRLYVYDARMNPLPAGKFEKTAQALLLSGGRKKGSKAPFELTWENDSFAGKAPAPASKPYHLEVKIKEGGKTYVSGFQNLD